MLETSEKHLSYNRPGVWAAASPISRDTYSFEFEAEMSCFVAQTEAAKNKFRYIFWRLVMNVK